MVDGPSRNPPGGEGEPSDRWVGVGTHVEVPTARLQCDRVEGGEGAAAEESVAGLDLVDLFVEKASALGPGPEAPAALVEAKLDARNGFRATRKDTGVTPRQVIGVAHPKAIGIEGKGGDERVGKCSRHALKNAGFSRS